MPSITHGDGKLFYTDEGKGDCLILLHGFCETHRMWDDWKLKLLEVKLRLICIDLPGFGDSSCTAQTIEEYARAVEAVVVDAKLSKAVLVGHSMGGYVSLAIAEQRPAWLQGFGLFHSHPFADSAEKKEARDRSIEFVERNGHLHYVKQLVPNFFAPERAGSYRHQQDRLILFASRGPAAGVIHA
ncbi:MAG: alpha/beta hydrolase, partial [Bacteroidota bacterium]